MNNKKKLKMDFISYKAPDERILFRFYPKYSSVHGFNESCPDSWDKVYKVYYSWAIFRQVKWTPDSDWETTLMFKQSCDECSRFGDVSWAIDNVQRNDKERIYLNVFGDGADWVLTFYKREGFMIADTIEFQVWDRITGKGYRFPLYTDEAEKFKRYINKVQNYMLAHSQPI